MTLVDSLNVEVVDVVPVRSVTITYRVLVIIEKSVNIIVCQYCTLTVGVLFIGGGGAWFSALCVFHNTDSCLNVSVLLTHCACMQW